MTNMSKKVFVSIFCPVYYVYSQGCFNDDNNMYLLLSGDQISELTEESESLRLALQTSKCQLSDVMEMLETLEMAKGKDQKPKLWTSGNY